jgi:hypothetical protein
MIILFSDHHYKSFHGIESNFAFITCQSNTTNDPIACFIEPYTHTVIHTYIFKCKKKVVVLSALAEVVGKAPRLTPPPSRRLIEWTKMLNSAQQISLNSECNCDNLTSKQVLMHLLWVPDRITGVRPVYYTNTIVCFAKKLICWFACGELYHFCSRTWLDCIFFCSYKEDQLDSQYLVHCRVRKQYFPMQN